MMVNLERQKLNYLSEVLRNSGIREAWRYYKQNEQRFRYPVYVPHLHMEVHGQPALKYINNSVGGRDTCLFIFGCKEDEELLLGGGNRYRINSSIVDQHMVSGFLTLIPP